MSIAAAKSLLPVGGPAQQAFLLCVLFGNTFTTRFYNLPVAVN
jgi:hypothetical protein